MSQEIIWPLTPADDATFTGRGWRTLIGSAEHELPIKLYYVRFDPASRTHWHTHSGPQILIVTAGRCRYQREGEPPTELAAGESVRFEAGVRHWHGAAAGQPAEHVAVNLDSGETTWFEAVTDEVVPRVTTA